MEMFFVALILFGAMGMGLSTIPVLVEDTIPILREIFEED